jgi:hypothetical protein
MTYNIRGLENDTMSRIFIGFLVAPLWVTAATASFAALTFPSPAQTAWVPIATITGTVFAYGGTLAFGLPAFLILRARNYTSFWIAAALGFGISNLTWMIFGVLFALSLGNSLAFIWQQATNLALPFLPIGALGSLIGATFWLIARPDRAPSYCAKIESDSDALQ